MSISLFSFNLTSFFTNLSVSTCFLFELKISGFYGSKNGVNVYLLLYNVIYSKYTKL